jgi:DNA-binding MarR family transcriptional regulator
MKTFVDDLVSLCRYFGMFERERVCCGTVTVQQCVVLQTLVEGPSEVGPLADAVGSSPSAMTRLIDGLVSRDWAERVRAADDRRCVHVHLTAQGQKEAARLRGLTEQSVALVLDAIPKNKRAQVMESVGLVRQAMTELRESAGFMSC